MGLDVQLSVRDASERSCEGIKGTAVVDDDVSDSSSAERTQGSFPRTLEVTTYSLHMHLTWNSTQLDSLRVLQVSYQEGEGVMVGNFFLFFVSSG